MYLCPLKYMAMSFVNADAQLLGGMDSEEWNSGREIKRNFHFFGKMFFNFFYSKHNLHVFLKSKPIYI